MFNTITTEPYIAQPTTVAFRWCWDFNHWVPWMDVGPSSYAQIEEDKSTQFVEKIQGIHLQVQNILQKPNAKYKQSHDQHHVPHKF
jgi:hypothetical protein